MGEENYTIGEFSRVTGLNRRTIDFYTRQGLLYPGQSAGGHGYRHYTQEDRRRVSLIKQLQARKLTLQEIRQALNSNGRVKASSALESIERVALSLEKLRDVVKETRSSASVVDQPAMRAVATEALQRATALSSLLVTLLQDLPLS